jgi:hypothetical protein
MAFIFVVEPLVYCAWSAALSKPHGSEWAAGRGQLSVNATTLLNIGYSTPAVMLVDLLS